MTLPDTPADSNRIMLDARMAVDRSGRLHGRLSARWRCISDPGFVADVRRAAPDDAKRTARERVLCGSLDARAWSDSLRFDGLTVEYACSLEVQGIATIAGDRLLVVPGRIRADELRLSGADRRTDLQFDYPIDYRSRVVLDLPPEWQVERLPAKHRAKDDLVFHRMDWTAPRR